MATLLGACHHRAPPPEWVQPAAVAHFPKSQRELPTTDASIAVANFLGLYQLASETKEAAQYVSLLSTHAQYFGVLDDYSRALEAAERTVRRHPKVAEAYLQRASARQALHLFDEALRDLVQAEKLGGDVEAARAGIFQAEGRFDEALAIRARRLQKRRTFYDLAAMAQLQGELGNVAEAEALFVEAQDHYEDPSPFGLAWLYFQAGLLEERNGRPSSAKELYRAAHERLPQYAPAAAHLASLVEAAQAIALLQPIVQASDDPEYQAQLGALTGDAALVEKARLRYQQLLQRHPSAFADHAARFWLGAGGDPRRALTLAERHLRPTREGYDLLVQAATAAGDDGVRCSAAGRLSAFPYLTAAHRFRADSALQHCKL